MTSKSQCGDPRAAWEHAGISKLDTCSSSCTRSCDGVKLVQDYSALERSSCKRFDAVGSRKGDTKSIPESNVTGETTESIIFEISNDCHSTNDRDVVPGQ